MRMFWGRLKANAPARHNGDQRNPWKPGRMGAEKHNPVWPVWDPKRVYTNDRACVNKEVGRPLFVNIPINVNVNVVNIV